MQVRDTVLIRGRQNALVGSTARLFNPRDHGIPVCSVSSACWRGFHCRYRLDGDRLVLQYVHCWVAPEVRTAMLRGEGPTLAGRHAQPSKEGWDDDALELTGVSLVLPPFDGTVVLEPEWFFYRELIFLGGRHVATRRPWSMSPELLHV